jgi:hypothetical protein
MLSNNPLLITLSAALLAAGGACAELDRGEPFAEVRPDTTADTALDTRDTTNGELPDDVAPDAEPGEADASPPISFADGAHQALVANCMAGGCHGAGAGGYSIVDDLDADYEATLARVVPGDAEASLLVKKGANRSSHAGGPALSPGSPEYDLVVAWIDDGAAP